MKPLAVLALQLAEEWLREVVIQGLAQVSSELIECGYARAVAVRQAGFPRIAKLMTESGELLRAGKDRVMYLTVQHCQRKIASIHASITALRQSPWPQTLTRLAGQYRRSYFPEQDLSMVAVGAEQWQSQSGYHGLSLYLFAIDKGHWYQYRQARPVNVDREWSPERAWRQESWCGVAFQSITGCRLTFNTLNVSLDRSITTTEHSNITLGAGDVKQLPVVYDFTGMRRYYYANSMPLNYDYLPVIVHVHACQQPYFDTAQQMGMQHIADQWDNPLKLTISTGQLTAKAYDYLDNQWHNSKKPQYVFGMLYLLDELLVVRAISVIFQGETQWKHMTLP